MPDADYYLTMRTLKTSINYLIIAITLAYGASIKAQSLEFIFADSMEINPAVVFRSTQLVLRDPHVFVDVPVFGCFDFTDNPVPVVGISFNGTVAEMLTSDDDMDGFLDLSILQGLDRFDPAGPGQMVSAVAGNCLAPVPSSGCDLQSKNFPASATSNNAVGICLEAISGTTSGYSPPVPVIEDACFLSAPSDTETTLAGLVLPLLQAQFSFGWAGNTLAPGLSLGFLREVDANTILLPDNLPLVGGQPLSSLLAGGQGGCASTDDRDIVDAEMGWWFYFETQAVSVPFTSSF